MRVGQTSTATPFSARARASERARRSARATSDGKLTRQRARSLAFVRASSSPADAEASTSESESRSAARTSTSVDVQRALARRMLEAQRSWVGASAATKDVDAGAEVVGVFAETYARVRWLLGLLILQSMSSVVLSGYEDLIRENIIVTLFLTMLVGAGGNAGNQSAIHVIRGLATGEMENTDECMRKTLAEQFQVGLLLGAALSSAGFLRVLLTSPEGTGDLVGPFAIATALFAIVTTSTCVGTILPFMLMKLKQDPANAGTSVQVIMDVSGVIITCTVCSFIFSHYQ